ncbi:MAG: glycosyltransferase family 39 protein [Nocardioidaceae bacterium]
MTANRLRDRPEWAVGLALFVLLVATSSRYGWHRDELYFVQAGDHPSWAYPDQPLFTPLLVATMAHLGHGSLVVVRLASAVASGAAAVVAGALAGEFGGTPRARLIAAATWGVGGVSLVTGHFVDTTTFDVLAAGLFSLFVARALRRGRPQWLAAAGLVLGVGLLDKLLVGIVAAVVCACILALGERRLLLSRWALLGAALALLGAAPYLIWQSLNGWPQLDLARSIGNSGAEGGQAGVIPFQFLLVSPVLTPVWVAGIVRLLRNPDARRFRPFGVAYLAMIVLVIATRGKAYYTSGLLLVMVSAGGVSVDVWLARGRRLTRRAWIVAGLSLSLVVDAVIGLAVVPASWLQPSGVQAVNPDAAEQVGWPQFTAAIADAWRQIPSAQRPGAVIFTGNYGEAGAVDRFGRGYGLPQAYSGHNAFAEWGPPSGSGPVVVVGYDPGRYLSAYFRDCRVVTHVDNGIGLPNDEQGDAVQLCSGPAHPWPQLWPRLIHYD